MNFILYLTHTKINIILKETKMKNLTKKIIIGTISGIVSGLFGAGGGLILIPAYSIAFHKTEKETKALAIFCILPMVVVSSVFYFFNNYINWTIALKCIIGEVIGSLIGSKILNSLNPKYLKLIFIIFLIYSSIRMLF